MKDKSGLQMKVQELCDCYATTDPLKGMSEINQGDDMDESALKWIALSALHGINANAEKISISLSENGDVRVLAEYRKTELPAPNREVGERIIQALRGMTHIQEEKGKTKLALGVRDNSVDLKVKIKREKGGEVVTLKFPE